jgi:uncharacterized protein involved in cysteine biosynthesis
LPYRIDFDKLRAMLPRLLPQILLIVALLLAQLGGLTHGFSHALAEQSRRTEQSQPTDLHCDLCDEYAQIGNAVRAHTLIFLPVLPDEIHYLTAVFIPVFYAFVAFSARAPPYSA